MDALAHADVFDRNIKLGLDGNGDTALCSSVQLRQNDTGDICHFCKLSCLLQRILARGTVQHHQRFQVCLWVLFFQNPVNLVELFHQVLLVVKSSCRITDQHIRISGFCRCDCIVHDGRRICSVLSADDIHAGAVRPLRELLACRCTERICCRKNNLFALILQKAGQLSDGGRFSDSIDTDHQYYRFPVFKFIGRVAYIHLFFDALDQKLFALCRIGNVLFCHPLF